VDQVTIVNGPMLYSLIEEFFPDLHDLQVDWHSPQAATVWMLDRDWKYTRWLASLSLDQRWTLSPLD
jgi:hypothetical protein